MLTEPWGGGGGVSQTLKLTWRGGEEGKGRGHRSHDATWGWDRGVLRALKFILGGVYRILDATGRGGAYPKGSLFFVGGGGREEVSSGP